MDAEQLVTVQEALSGRYRVDGILGHGGMATVYRAVDLANGALVAIKVLRPELAPIGFGRFAREVNLTVGLDHPNILPVLDTGKIGALPYLVMPLVELPSLRDRLARQPQLPLSEAIDIAIEIAGAAGMAHAKGIVHRDIKPSNVFVGDDHVILADFGIARLAEELEEERITDSGIAVGTPGYMSPEQIAAQPHIDGRSDIYSIGCVLYEMLTGELPFTGRSRPAIFAKQVSLPPPSAATLRHTVPVAVDSVIQRALAKTPADRFDDAASFVQALTEARTDKRSSAAQRGPTLGRRSRLAALGVAVLTVGGLFLWRAAMGPPDTLNPQMYVVLPFQRGANVEATVSPGQVRDVLARWSDIQAVDGQRTAERVGDLNEADLSPAVADDIARDLGAAWHIHGVLTEIGDSVRLQMTLGDARPESGTIPREVAVRVPRSGAVDDSTLMRHRVHLYAGIVALSVVASACDGARRGQEGRRECPHDWPRELQFSDPEQPTRQVTAVATYNGPGAIVNVPEFHDCQRFIVRESGTLRYDSLFAIFATTRLATLDTEQEPRMGLGLPAAEIVAWNDYQALNIRTGFNCLYLFRKPPRGPDGGWGAVMVPFGTMEQDCSQRVDDPTQLPAARVLRVVAHQDSLLTGAQEYPAAARWDWDSTRARQYIGIRCGAAWCGVGEAGFTPSPTYASKVPNASSVLASYRVMEIKGWHDQQILAGPVSSAGIPQPSGIVGTLIPHPDLASQDSAAFRERWVVTSYIALEVPQGVDNHYEKKFNLTATAPNAGLSELNTVSLCHGAKDQCVGSSPTVETCGDGRWWARIENADPANTEVGYSCVQHYPVNMTIPGIVRWRWLVDDEGEWMRCPQGCCELVRGVA